MRLHENNNEDDELQRLRARRQGTGRSRRSVSNVSRSASSRANYKTAARQSKTVDHTYDEDYYEEEDYDYDDDRGTAKHNTDHNRLEVPFENENRRSRRVNSAGSYEPERTSATQPENGFSNSFSGSGSNNSNRSRRPS